MLTFFLINVETINGMRLMEFFSSVCEAADELTIRVYYKFIMKDYNAIRLKIN